MQYMEIIAVFGNPYTIQTNTLYDKNVFCITVLGGIHEGTSKIFWTGAAIYTPLVVARITGEW
jgi:hypothetical protein